MEARSEPRGATFRTRAESDRSARSDWRDPRVYQIGSLAALLAYGLLGLDFDVTLPRVAWILASVLLAQLAGTRLFRLSRFDPKSALISGLSLCLLMRTGSTALAVCVAAVTIGGKFLLRWNGKHLFNPTNFGLVAAMLATSQVWVSPGQWGSVALFTFAIACLGTVVVTRAARADVTAAFLACHAGLLLARSAQLGEPLAIPLHRLESGALLLFAFFMISDPKTTPDSRSGRILFGCLVATGAAFVQFRLFRTNGLLWSLAFFSLFVPLIDLLFPGKRYSWTRPAGLVSLGSKGASDAPPSPDSRLLSRPLGLEPSRAGVLRVLRGEGGRETL